MVCVQEGSGCCDHQAENFHVVTPHGCAVLLKQGHLPAQLLVCADLHPWHAQVRQMGRRGRGCYWQLPQSPRQVVLLLHGRQLPHQQRVRPKGGPCASRGCFSSGTCASSSAQWCSPAISTRVLNASSPWCLREPAPHFHARASLQFGTCCLAHLGGEPYGDKWLECCGFVVLPGSQKDWLILCQLSWASRPPTRRSSSQPLQLSFVMSLFCCRILTFTDSS